MASIYKRSRDKKKKNVPYQIEYVDADGVRRVVKGFTDKGLTEQLAAKLENEVMLRKRGMIDPLAEQLAVRRQSLVGDALDAFRRSLDNTTPKHQKLTMTRVTRLVGASGAKTLGDLDSEKVEEALKAIRREEDLGARTYNHYLQAIDEFGKWLVASKRLAHNPVAGIERLNAETDVRHARRALTPEEVARLVDSARSSGVEVQGYDGELRARAYLVSFFTGLRRQELGSLTPRSFKLDAPQPTLSVDAACSKHRRKDTLPMHPELVAMVREWVSGMEPEDLLFPRIERKKTWLMVKKDLERVGIPYETHEGIADFHAAGRHSHITGLLRHGATLVEARELARHADVRMTMKYTHIGLEDQADALAGLPNPNAYRSVDGLGIGWNSGGAQGQEESPDDTDGPRGGGSQNEQAPAGPGLVSSVVANCHQITGCGPVEAAGIAPATSVYQMVLTIASVEPLVSDLFFGHPDTSRPCVSCAPRSEHTDAPTGVAPGSLGPGSALMLLPLSLLAQGRPRPVHADSPTLQIAPHARKSRHQRIHSSLRTESPQKRRRPHLRLPDCVSRFHSLHCWERIFDNTDDEIKEAERSGSGRASIRRSRLSRVPGLSVRARQKGVRPIGPPRMAPRIVPARSLGMNGEGVPAR